MPISGLVITLASPCPEALKAETWLRGDKRFSVGDSKANDNPGGLRLPITLETNDRQEDKLVWQQMQDHAGIAFVDVTCVFFEDDMIEETPPTDCSPLTQGVGRGNH